jgi:hypothetical protein
MSCESSSESGRREPTKKVFKVARRAFIARRWALPASRGSETNFRDAQPLFAWDGLSVPKPTLCWTLALLWQM